MVFFVNEDLSTPETILLDMLKTYAVEDENMPDVIRFLEGEGFTNICRMPRLALYDLEATKRGRRVYIEVKIRSADKAPYFVLTAGKLNRLKELKRATGRQVYLVFKWGRYIRMCEIDNLKRDMKPIRVTLSSKKVPAYRFPARGEVTSEEIDKMIDLARKGYTLREIAERLNRQESTVRRYLPEDVLKSLKRGGEVRTEARKERISITMEREVLMELDKLVREHNKKNPKITRSWLIEKFVREGLERERYRRLSNVPLG